MSTTTAPPAADATSRPAAPAGGELGHMPALDGLRALAVVAVIVYHGDVGALTGGFVGVDLFFVLSGFLITSLLLAEHRRTGGVDLRRFWSRRFRRLLPALLVFLAAVGIWALVAADPTTLDDIRRASLAGLGYVANWWFIAAGTTYGASFSAPSPVLHLWSLSVEEQYYVVWPLLVAAVFGLAARRARSARRTFLVLAVGAAALSTAWMVLLSVRGASPDRLYFGTDTRAATILVGVVLALVLEPVVAARRHRQPGHAGPDAGAAPAEVTPSFRRARQLAAVLGLAGAAVLVVVALTAHEHDPWLFRGGLTLVAIAAAAVIGAAVLHPAADRWLGVAPLRWAGTRSYGLYLWHWGVLVALAVALPELTGWWRLAVAVPLTALIAETSYRLVEHPIRSGRVRLPRPRVLVPAAFASVACVLLVGTIGAVDPPEYLRTRSPDDVAMVEPPSTTATTVPAPTPAAPTPTAPAASAAPAPASTPTTGAPPTTVAPILHPTRVALVGDSVAASLSPALARAFAARGVAYANAAFPGCGVLVGDPADAQGRPLSITSACSAGIPGNQRTVVARTRPDLVVVLSTWEDGERVVDGTWYPYGTPEADAQLLRLYGEMLDRVTARGARVALVTVPDPVDSARGPAAAEQVRRGRHLNDLLARIAASDPIRVSLVRLDDIVCPTDPCPRSVDGVELRAKDGAHFDDPAAAALVASRLVPLVLDVPAGQRR